MKQRTKEPLYKTKRFLTRKEAAEILGVTQQTVSNYIERGLLVENTDIDGIRTPRLYSSSLKYLLDKGYDVIKQNNAIKQARMELKKEENELAEMKRSLAVLREEFGSQAQYVSYLSKIKSVLMSLISSNNDISERQRSIINGVLDGNSFHEVAIKHHLSNQRILQIFHETIKELTEIDYPSVKTLQNKNKRLHAKIMNLKEVIAEMQDLGSKKVIYLPEILIGRKNMHKLFSARVANALRIYGLENAYELALMPPTQIKIIRNLGEGSYREIQKKLKDMGISPGDMSSLQNPILETMPEKNAVLLEGINCRRIALQSPKNIL